MKKQFSQKSVLTKFFIYIQTTFTPKGIKSQPSDFFSQQNDKIRENTVFYRKPYSKQIQGKSLNNTYSFDLQYCVLGNAKQLKITQISITIGKYTVMQRPHFWARSFALMRSCSEENLIKTLSVKKYASADVRRRQKTLRAVPIRILRKNDTFRAKKVVFFLSQDHLLNSVITQSKVQMGASTGYFLCPFGDAHAQIASTT